MSLPYLAENWPLYLFNQQIRSRLKLNLCAAVWHRHASKLLVAKDRTKHREGAFRFSIRHVLGARPARLLQPSDLFYFKTFLSSAAFSEVQL